MSGMVLGSHLSIAGGAHKAVEKASEYGFEAVGIFVRNQLRWRSPPLTDEAYMTLGSATARGISSSLESIAPVSKKMTELGALMCLAAMAASIEMPVPQKTMTPSLIIRAAATAISSLAVYSDKSNLLHFLSRPTA